ncbi:MAG: hypothetical protein KGQ54_04160 [Verrucomicrobia bacterium]|nr:hypothetical protein [Verrucomicrobiota bacterium]NDE62823.1 hypothetical protein [Chlamydiota bacterium]
MSKSFIGIPLEGFYLSRIFGLIHNSGAGILFLKLFRLGSTMVRISKQQERRSVSPRKLAYKRKITTGPLPQKELKSKVNAIQNGSIAAFIPQL